AHALRAVAERAGSASGRARRRPDDARRPDGAHVVGSARRRQGARRGADRPVCAARLLVRPPSLTVQLVNVLDYEVAAAATLGPGPLGYFAGGAGDEVTLRENVAAYGRYLLRPRVLVDVGACTTTTTVLGREIAMPLLVAPVAFQRLAHPDGEVATARAAREAGTIMCLSTIATASPAEVAETGAHRWFQLYAMRDHAVPTQLIGQRRSSGDSALLRTVGAR